MDVNKLKEAVDQLPVEETLRILKEQIIEAYCQNLHYQKMSAQAAIQCGTVLLRAKQILHPLGKWTSWIEEEVGLVGLSRRTADRYITLVEGIKQHKLTIEDFKETNLKVIEHMIVRRNKEANGEVFSKDRSEGSDEIKHVTTAVRANLYQRIKGGCIELNSTMQYETESLYNKYWDVHMEERLNEQAQMKDIKMKRKAKPMTKFEEWINEP